MRRVNSSRLIKEKGAERLGRDYEFVEDNVVFEGAIRKSGNSLVITIPSELSKRFMLKDGQKVMIVGMTGKGSVMEGAIKVMLGAFRVEERAYSIKFKVSKKVDEDLLLEFVERVGYNYGATDYRIHEGEKYFEVELVFGILGMMLRPKSFEDVEAIGDKVRVEARKAGIRLRDLKVVEEVIEHTDVDPSELARFSSRLRHTDRLKWEWVV